MVNCGNLLVLVCTVGVVMSMSEANILNFCCPAVTTQEIKEPILEYFYQRAKPPCVTAIIFRTQSGLFCCSRMAPWVRRKIVEFESAKARPTPLSLLPITPTASTFPLTLSARRHPSKKPLCCDKVTTINMSTVVVGNTYQEQDAAHSCVKAVIFDTNDGKLCADPNAQWVMNLKAGMTKM